MLALGRVTIEEAQRLLLWAKKEGKFPKGNVDNCCIERQTVVHVLSCGFDVITYLWPSSLSKIGFGSQVVTGFSMGGVHAAMIACLHPEPIACAPICAPHSAAEPFCDQLLWKATQAAREPQHFLGPVSFTSAHGHMDDIQSKYLCVEIEF